MDFAAALVLLACLAWIVEEARKLHFAAPHRWKWALGWVFAVLIVFAA